MVQKTTILLATLAALCLLGIAAIGILRAQTLPPVPGSADLAPPRSDLDLPRAERPVPTERPVFTGLAKEAPVDAQPGAEPHATPPTASTAAPAVSPPSVFYQSLPGSRYTMSWPIPGTFNVAGAEPDEPELNKLRQADAAMGKQADQLAERYAASEDAEQRNAIKAELTEHLTNHFSVQQQIRDRELARVEARVKKLRELTQKRREAQKTIVEQRLDQLVREAEGLGWTPPASDYGSTALSRGGQQGASITLPAPQSIPPAPPRTH
jgi:hypothetical protein